MDKPAISAIIEISIDTDNDTYKTKSYLEVAEEYADDDLDVPRDVLLGMVYELESMSRKIADRTNITVQEYRDYLKQRKLVDEQSIEEPKFKKKKDVIDQTIDNLFDDDENSTNS